jgi:phospholipase C
VAVSRREFLAQMAIAAGAAALGCSDTNDPDPDPPETGSIDNIVIVTMENRSFDHLLGWVPGADGKQSGLSYPDTAGVLHATHRLTQYQSCEFADPNHSVEGGLTEYNNGACDGWLRAPGNDTYAIGYYVGADLPFLGKAATEWLVLDRYFCPIMGPTFPNRILSLAATTDRLSNTLVASTLPTIWDRLIPAGKTGKNYASSILSTTALWGSKYSDLIRPITEFYSDAAQGTLPNLSFVDPILIADLRDSYHPPEDIRRAEAFLEGVYRAVTTGPQWKTSLLIITFDEWGGFFDHVPPPTAQIPQAEAALGNPGGLRGFRIPTILVSPFVKRKSVSSRVYDHSSVLRMIETRWNLQPLTIRDQTANDLTAEIDLALAVTAAPQFEAVQGPFLPPCP